jgi:hypothetical protein
MGQTEERIGNARRNRHSQRVVDEGEEQILPNVSHDIARQPPRANDAAQISLSDASLWVDRRSR